MPGKVEGQRRVRGDRRAVDLRQQAVGHQQLDRPAGGFGAAGQAELEGDGGVALAELGAIAVAAERDPGRCEVHRDRDVPGGRRALAVQPVPRVDRLRRLGRRPAASRRRRRRRSEAGSRAPAGRTAVTVSNGPMPTSGRAVADGEPGSRPSVLRAGGAPGGLDAAEGGSRRGPGPGPPSRRSPAAGRSPRRRAGGPPGSPAARGLPCGLRADSVTFGALSVRASRAVASATAVAAFRRLPRSPPRSGRGCSPRRAALNPASRQPSADAARARSRTCATSAARRSDDPSGAVRRSPSIHTPLGQLEQARSSDIHSVPSGVTTPLGVPRLNSATVPSASGGSPGERPGAVGHHGVQLLAAPARPPARRAPAPDRPLPRARRSAPAGHGARAGPRPARTPRHATARRAPTAAPRSRRRPARQAAWPPAGPPPRAPPR